MIFTETEVPGVFIIDLEQIEDERGFFARTWCRREFEARRLETRLAQCSVSFNKKKGTLRGMHMQRAPHAEAKLVRCTRGAVYDVALDLRPGSSAFKKWVAVTLTAENHRCAYIPEGVAHGFQTLEDDTEVLYQISEFFEPQYAFGVRWNDSAFGIRWPEASRIISTRDRDYPDFQ